MTGSTLDPSCPVAPLMPYLLHFNATEIEQEVQNWAKAEADSFGSSIPVAIILVSVSALMLLAGERLTKVAIFLSGFLIAAAVSLLVADSALDALSASPTAGCATLIAAPFVFGLLGGALALYMLTVAFACVGFTAGAAVGQALYLLFLHHVSTGVTILSHDAMYFIVILAVAIPASVLMAIHKEGMMIIATAALGAVGLIPGLAILILSRIDSRFLWVTDPSDANVHRASPFVYGQVLAAIPYFLIGVAVQRIMRREKQKAATEVQPYGLFQDGTHTRGWNGSSNA